MTIWLPPLVLFLLVVLFSAWAARRAGALAGVAIAIAMAGHRSLYEGFIPSYVDHHGLATGAVMGLVLGAVFMGAGWWSEREGHVSLLPGSKVAAHRAAIVSGLSGAVGMWVSAASAIPAIAIVGIAGVIAGVIAATAPARTMSPDRAQFDANLWRTWGRVGAAASFCFYLAEYFPSHLGLRLEANHPVYSLAWLGGSELIASIAEVRLKLGDTGTRKIRVAIALALMAIAPLAIFIGGSTVFVPLDPFMAALHRNDILEFQPLWASFRGVAWNPYTSAAGVENVPLLAGAGLLALRGRRCGPVVWFATLVCAAMTAMAWLQMRWILNASGAQICLALLLFAHFTVGRAAPTRWAAMFGVFGVLFIPNAVTRIVAPRAQVEAHAVAPEDAIPMLFRDVAAAVRASQPAGEITVLASPNASVELGYYGGFKTVGTFYWENSAGLKAAAAIFSASTAEEAATLIRERKITHLVLASEGDFIGAYFRLLHPDVTEAEFERSFGYQLFVGNKVPAWLQIVPYALPEDMRALDARVLVFKVAFDQTPAVAMYHTALAEATAGNLPDALRDFDAAIHLDSTSSQSWLGKSGVLFAQRNWAGAADAALRGIARAPLPDQSALYGQVAGSLLAADQPVQAVRVSRAALAERFDPDVACFLAFVLSTSSEASVRRGPEAVELGRRALATDRASAKYQTCLAAALAETGDYSGAATAAGQAMASARGDADAQHLAEQMLAAFKAGRPWRQ